MAADRTLITQIRRESEMDAEEVAHEFRVRVRVRVGVRVSPEAQR